MARTDLWSVKVFSRADPKKYILRSALMNQKSKIRTIDGKRFGLLQPFSAFFAMPSAMHPIFWGFKTDLDSLIIWLETHLQKKRTLIIFHILPPLYIRE